MRWNVLIALFCYLLVVAGIGYVVWSRRQRLTGGRTEDYFVGGRSLGPWLLLFTILASLASAGTFVGGPGVAYEVGWTWVIGGLSWVPATIFILGPLSKKFAIVARKLRSLTVTDILRHRYESKILVLAASLGLVIFLIAYMVAQFVGGARVLQSVTGLPYTWGVVIFGVIVAAYTAFGGFKADVVTDLFQGLVMLVGSFVLWFAVLSFVSWSDITSQLRQADPALMTLEGAGDLTIPLLASYWLVFGIFFAALPHVAVRAMSYRDTQAMHRAMVFGPVVGYVFSMGFAVMGVAAIVLLPNLQSADMAVPTLIAEYVPGWLAGALLAAPMAAIMSTIDSMILIVSAAIVKDVFHNYVRKDASDRQLARLSAGTSSVVGLLVLVVSLRPPDLVQFIVIFAIGGLQATLFWPLLLGLYWKRGNTLGATLSVIGGLGTYLLSAGPLPQASLGMDPLVVSLTASGVLYVVGTYAGRPPSRDIIAKFWGTEREVARVLAAEAPSPR